MIRNLLLRAIKERTEWFMKTLVLVEVVLVLPIAGGIVLLLLLL